jgi:hypothetical protein
MGDENYDAIYLSDSGKNMDELNRSLSLRLKKMNHDMAAVVGNNLEETILALNEHYASTDRKLHLLLDETQPLFSDSSTVLRFRAYNQELASIKFTYSIFPHVFSNMQEYGSRFQDSVVLVPLRPFEKPAIDQLVFLASDENRLENLRSLTKSFSPVKPYVFDYDVTSHMQELTGGLPYFIQGLMSDICNIAIQDFSGVIKKEGFERAVTQYSFHTREQISHLWNSLTDIQRNMLTSILKGDKTSDDLRTLAKGNPSQYFGALRPLSDDGVGIIEEVDGKLAIRGRFMREALAYLGGFT